MPIARIPSCAAHASSCDEQDDSLDTTQEPDLVDSFEEAPLIDYKTELHKRATGESFPVHLTSSSQELYDAIGALHAELGEESLPDSFKNLFHLLAQKACLASSEDNDTRSRFLSLFGDAPQESLQEAYHNNDLAFMHQWISGVMDFFQANASDEVLTHIQDAKQKLLHFSENSQKPFLFSYAMACLSEIIEQAYQDRVDMLRPSQESFSIISGLEKEELCGAIQRQEIPIPLTLKAIQDYASKESRQVSTTSLSLEAHIAAFSRSQIAEAVCQQGIFDRSTIPETLYLDMDLLDNLHDEYHMLARLMVIHSLCNTFATQAGHIISPDKNARYLGELHALLANPQTGPKECILYITDHFGFLGDKLLHTLCEQIELNLFPSAAVFQLWGKRLQQAVQQFFYPFKKESFNLSSFRLSSLQGYFEDFASRISPLIAFHIAVYDGLYEDKLREVLNKDLVHLNTQQLASIQLKSGSRRVI